MSKLMSNEAPPGPLHQAEELPFISIVMPVRNEELYIEQTLAQLSSQEYPRPKLEVIVVDGESSDGTKAVVERFKRRFGDLSLQIENNPRRLSSAARNIGVKVAKGEYVLIVDGHVQIPSSHLLADAAAIVLRTGAKVLGRPQRLSPTGIDKTQRMISAVRGSRLGHAADSYIYSDAEGWAPPSSIAVMYARSIFEEYGGFDERFDAAEDFEFNCRIENAGLKCYTSPKLEVFYYPRKTLGSLAKQMVRYGMGRARLMRKQRKLDSLTTIAPASALVIGGMLLLLAPFSTIASALVALCAVAYITLVTAEYARSAALREHPFALVVATFLIVHGGLGWGFLKGIATPFPSDEASGAPNPCPVTQPLK
jgi:succinoglycan biosynthesis protein ExoA